MPSDALVELAIFVITLIFAAGGAWFLLKQTRRHVNGVGAKVNRLVMALMLIVPEEQKKDIAQLILGDPK